MKCVVRDSAVRKNALEFRRWRITVFYQTLHNPRLDFNNVLQHLNELDVNSLNYDSMEENWKSFSMKVISSFKDARNDMAVICGRKFGALDQADKIRLNKCGERFNNFSRFVPRPAVPSTSPADANVESDHNAGAVNNNNNPDGNKRIGKGRTRPVERTNKKARPRTKSRTGNVGVNDYVYKGRASASMRVFKSDAIAIANEFPAISLQRRRFDPSGGAYSASLAESFAGPTSTPSRIRNTLAHGGAISAASNEPPARTVMESNMDGLALNPGNLDPLKGTVWVTESGAEIDEGRKKEQYRGRQRGLPACIAHTIYGDVQVNVAAYILTPSEIDAFGEHARRIFFDRSNMFKSTCR